MDDLDALVRKQAGAPYPHIRCQRSEGRSRLRCLRCGASKRVSRAAEKYAEMFARLAADFLVRHRGCVERHGKR